MMKPNCSQSDKSVRVQLTELTVQPTELRQAEAAVGGALAVAEASVGTGAGQTAVRGCRSRTQFMYCGLVTIVTDVWWLTW